MNTIETYQLKELLTGLAKESSLFKVAVFSKEASEDVSERYEKVNSYQEIYKPLYTAGWAVVKNSYWQQGKANTALHLVTLTKQFKGVNCALIVRNSHNRTKSLEVQAGVILNNGLTMPLPLYFVKERHLGRALKTFKNGRFWAEAVTAQIAEIVLQNNRVLTDSEKLKIAEMAILNRGEKVTPFSLADVWQHLANSKTLIEAVTVAASASLGCFGRIRQKYSAKGLKALKAGKLKQFAKYTKPDGRQEIFKYFRSFTDKNKIFGLTLRLYGEACQEIF